MKSENAIGFFSGMHNILNQPQYYNALKGKQQDDSTGTTFAGVIRGYEPKETPDEPDNETDVDDCIKYPSISSMF